MATINSFDELSSIKGFKLAHLNIRSLPKKVDQLRILVSLSNIDVITLSETWLKPHLHTGIYDIDGFTCNRLDRKVRAGKRKRGGGLITYINNKHASVSEPLGELDLSGTHIEAQWTLIHRPHCKNVVICNVYRPPDGNLDAAVTYLDECLKVVNTSKVDVFLIGDMNVNYLNKSSPNYKKMLFFSQSNSFTQYINNTTRNTDKTKSLIDLALSNSKFIKCSGTLDHFISDHQPIFLVHKKVRDVRAKAEFIGRSYRNYNKQAFEDGLADLDWGGYYGIVDAEEAWSFLLNGVKKVLDTMCPLRSFQIKNYRPDWMTDDLIEQIKDRDYFYRKAKRTGGEDDWNIAKHLRNITNSNIRQAKKEFILEELKNNEKDPKKFWKVIRQVIPSDKTAQRDILLKDNDKGKKLDREDVASYINDYFVNVGNISVQDESRDTRNGTETILPTGSTNLKSLSEITKGEVVRVVKEINTSKSSGLEHLSSFVVKEVFGILVKEVTHMFNLSITNSIFPAAWKSALVIPIPKTGDLTAVKNYRPISLLPLPGKILEKLVHAQLSNYLEGLSLLKEEQHGFRSNHSTVHSVAQLTNFVNTKMDGRLCTLATYIDFRKAFDCVQHPVLIDKLSSLGLDEAAVAWMKSYLAHRKQRVLANGIYSPYLPITQGVPQGSVLGPLFYIVYANDLPDIIKNCEIALYADDTVLYTASKSFDLSLQRMQADLDNLSGWCRLNGIRVNTEKSKVMVFGSPQKLKDLPPLELKLDDVLLHAVTSYKYLGMTLDSQLNYNLHVNKLISLVSSKLKLFQRMRTFLSVRAAIMVYKGTILPLLEYGDVFLSATSVKNRKKLQTLQNKGLRCALNKGIETGSEDLHSEANLLKLHYRREQHLLNYMYDWSLNPGKLKTRPFTNMTTRLQAKKLMKLRKPNTEKFKKMFGLRGTQEMEPVTC